MLCNLPLTTVMPVNVETCFLVWLADQTGIRGVLTTDVTDFAVYRLKGGKRFESMGWFG